MILQHLVSLLGFVNSYFLSCQSITSPTVFESFNNKDGGNCTKKQPGFNTLSVVECLLHCKLEKGGKDAVMENGGTICFCVECETPEKITEKKSQDTMVNSTFYRELKVLKVSGPIAATKQPICYQPKDNEYATFKMPHKGIVRSVTLIYVSGKLQCTGMDQTTNWGCNTANYPSQPGPHDIIVSITDDQDKTIFPDELMNAGGFITVPGVDLDSQELTLEPSSPYAVQEPDKEMRVWYNQDLIDGSEQNNTGEQCVHVVINYA
ncbi:uncharacterized protein [Clytia hemisphaerica]|uniref:Cnidarian restricted protein n=1 Tax=Clytia hemisphaerica TaxID=252671 RepID=A0A7M5XGY8_9CNID|eukprot:TCONS_00035398-protein